MVPIKPRSLEPGRLAAFLLFPSEDTHSSGTEGPTSKGWVGEERAEGEVSWGSPREGALGTGGFVRKPRAGSRAVSSPFLPTLGEEKLPDPDEPGNMGQAEEGAQHPSCLTQRGATDMDAP